ncbi:50S ribosomal protein L6 [Candidatus Wolfebacteria bacterium RIFOXYD12_FULL_48_21]|uniref:50S ribosomal protein L6 n=1 Tax=Candidatus Wolfebacteria bacterium RIFOXYD1_FULL_48_65 TaxID=1802561 RepID=A0A1F8E4L4_9BACT|nr:MAG: 50S ribosomal protein L6 [Candidatus Wolfebacteria bacterium RIFOXYD12_FULL_48_21]OGM95640.1 MAG: 50S ribosomal protein L6 [Candidatus Wolfebacteria bacterium RIFOXYD1_FULL_48_65]OGM96742.1 MAG: 50S ribosomal protein L6 [Candidatus Wolfebacteria bacterium RIFOXYD2_FULL_48_11]
MSKVGKKPIIIPEGVTVIFDGAALELKKGENIVKMVVLQFVKTEIGDVADADGVMKNAITFTIDSNTKQAKSNWGTMRALTANAIQGVLGGFTKVLEIEGVGYRAAMDGENLVLNIGFSHPVKYEPRKGIKLSVEKNAVTVTGIDKAMVGQTAAEIRKVRKPEPYKGKGIRYRGEVVRRKQGKKVGK